MRTKTDAIASADSIDITETEQVSEQISGYSSEYSSEQAQFNEVLWRIFSTFQGTRDASIDRDCFLNLFFLKCVWDEWREQRAILEARHADTPAILTQELLQLRLFVPPRCEFDFLVRQVSNPDASLADVVNKALEKLEAANPRKLTGVFRGNLSLSPEAVARDKDRNRRLSRLLEDLSQLDLRPSQINQIQRDKGNNSNKGNLLGNAFRFLIERFASDTGRAGKRGDDFYTFYTPGAVSTLLAKLLQPQPGSCICDPTAGSGSLLLHVAQAVPGDKHNYSLYGQEADEKIWALCWLNLFLHGEEDAVVPCGDTLAHPLLLEGSNLDKPDKLMTFDIVVAHPPLSLYKWADEGAANDRWGRFHRGVPPGGTPDWAFLSHMIETSLPHTGRVGLVVPHGPLFRGGAEGRIREQFIRENLLDAVIALPEKLFFGMAIPTAILLFDRSREAGGPNESRTDVLFIDASEAFAPGKNQNRLTPDHIQTIADTYHDRTETERFSRRVPIMEIVQNQFNLNIVRYMGRHRDPAGEQEAVVDLVALADDITRLEQELSQVRSALSERLGALSPTR